MKIYLGADHRGYKLKNEIKGYLEDQGHEVVDKGAHEYNSDDDYPDFAIAVAEAVAQDKDSKGILVCGSSIGVAVTANKVKGIIASQVRTKKEAEEDIKHHDSNVMAISADHVNEEHVNDIIDTWLTTDFEGGRHARRIQKIKDYENHHKGSIDMADYYIPSPKGFFIILLFVIFICLLNLIINLMRIQQLENPSATNVNTMLTPTTVEVQAESGVTHSCNPRGFTCKGRAGQCFGPATTGAGYIFCDTYENPQGANDCGTGGPNVPFCTREGVGQHCDGTNIVKCDGTGNIPYVIQQCNSGCNASTDSCNGGGTTLSNPVNPNPAITTTGCYQGTTGVVPAEGTGGTGTSGSCNKTGFTCKGRANQCFGPQTTGAGYIYCDASEKAQGVADCGTGGPHIPFCTREGAGRHCDGKNIVKCDAVGNIPYAVESCNNGCNGSTDTCIGGGTAVTNPDNQNPGVCNSNPTGGTGTSGTNGTGGSTGAGTCGYPSNYSYADLNSDSKVSIYDLICLANEYRNKRQGN